MVSELVTKRYASEDDEPRREVYCEIPHRLERGNESNEDAESRKGVDCEIPHRLERRTSAS